MKHISFDVWNTLISANPTYAEDRTQFLTSIFGAPDALKIKMIYSKVKSFFDSGEDRDHSNDAVYRTLIAELSSEFEMVKSISTNEIRDEFTRMFLKNPPIILGGLVASIQKYHQCGITISIGSNSNFISGDVMHPFLISKFGDIFKFGIYSDLIGSAKPSREFFNLIHEKAGLPRQEILHIGDDLRCDVGGAITAGFQHMLVKNPADLFDKL